jgi:hypothetical protein
MYVYMPIYLCTVYMYVYVPVYVSVRRVGLEVYLASYLTSDIVRPVSPVLSIGWEHVLILVEVGEGDM